MKIHSSGVILVLLSSVQCTQSLVVWERPSILKSFPTSQRTKISSSSTIKSIPKSPSSLSSSSSSNSDLDIEAIGNRVIEELKEVSACASLCFEALAGKSDSTSPDDLVKVCDELEAWTSNDDLFVSSTLELRRRALEFKRYEMLVQMMKVDYNKYTATASFLSPSRIPRAQLPNVQDVAYNLPGQQQQDEKKPPALTSEEGLPLVADCELDNIEYNESPLDKFLLNLFRKFVEQNTGGVTSPKEGILGLLEQGRTFYLQPGQTAEAQHKMVRDTLGGLMTPVLPPFYRIFMSGIIPKVGPLKEFDGKQIGPWFYAPFLTSFVTPTFFGFLVGPSTPNRRKDGELGGLVVEKCKFLQESGCKGMCLHICKLPAQQFFKDELGLPLTVSPNFDTQECQWSFGEEPLEPEDDPSFPKGCLVGCESRKQVAASGGVYADICN